MSFLFLIEVVQDHHKTDATFPFQTFPETSRLLLFCNQENKNNQNTHSLIWTFWRLGSVFSSSLSDTLTSLKLKIKMKASNKKKKHLLTAWAAHCLSTSHTWCLLDVQQPCTTSCTDTWDERMVDKKYRFICWVNYPSQKFPKSGASPGEPVQNLVVAWQSSNVPIKRWRFHLVRWVAMTGATGRRRRRGQQPCCKRKPLVMFFFQKCTWDAALRSFLANRCCASWDLCPPSTSPTLPHPPPSVSPPPVMWGPSPALPPALFPSFCCLGPKIHKQRPSNVFLPKLLSAIWFSEQVTQPAGGKGGNTGGGGEGEWGGRDGGEEGKEGGGRSHAWQALQRWNSQGVFWRQRTTTEVRRCNFLLWMLRRRREEAFDPEWPPRQPPWWHVLNSCSRFRVSPIERGFCGDSRVECVNQSHWSWASEKTHKNAMLSLIIFIFFHFHSDGSWLSRKWGRSSWTAPFCHEPRTPADISFAAMNLMSELKKKKSPIHSRLVWLVLVWLKEKQ